MNNITAIFTKQIKETLKNSPVLIQFLMFPLLVLIMENAVNISDMPEHFFVKMFASMFVGMAPLTCMSSVISEEKEKNTLRALMMSNVKPLEYLAGIGAYIFIACMLGAVVFAVSGEYTGSEFGKFLGIMALGIIISMLIGAVIGTSCNNQMAAASISVPVMLVFSILPMLAMFNESIEKIARVTFSMQINLMINNMEITAENAVVIAINIFIPALLFVCFIRKKGLE